MATCQICKYAGNPKDKPPCSDCKGYSKYEYEKPQTNADRIRAMSDEELARFLADKLENEYILSCKRLNYNEHMLTATEIKAIRHTCYCIWMRWLKQSAEVTDNG